MSATELLQRLRDQRIVVANVNGELKLRGNKEALQDTALLSELRANKDALLKLVHESEQGDTSGGTVPPNGIPDGCQKLTPQMLPLVALSHEDIERIVAAVTGGAANIQDIYPLAPLQEGILFHHLMAAQGDPYQLPAFFGFDTRARLDRYLIALQSVIDRHDVLRTAVVWEGLPEPLQVVWRRAPLMIEELTLDAADGDVVEQLRARFDVHRYRFDVRQAPLLRIFIAEDRTHDRWVMLQMLHHLVGDHTTFDVLQLEVKAHLLGETHQLPAPLPFRNFVAQSRLGVSREEHEQFFRQMLAEVTEPTTPFGLSDVQGDGSQVAESRCLLSAELSSGIRRCARQLGVSTASVCHLAWAQVLSRATGREDVVFGTLLFGRMAAGEGSDRALGMFINTLPVRIRIGEERVRDAVRRTHGLLSELLRHEHASLALAQRCSAVAATLPLFSALLNYRHIGATARLKDAPSWQRQDGWEGIEFLQSQERTNYPLVLSVDDFGDALGLSAQVSGALDPQRICAYLQRALEVLVEALEKTPHRKLQTLDVMPPAERQQVVCDWNRTTGAYPQRRLHEFFEAQAARQPQALAVVYGDERWDYRSLNEQSNRLAHYLRAQGVKGGALVGVCLSRTPQMIVGLMAIVKAGGAYVPLDPQWPCERIGGIVQELQLQRLLSEPSLLALMDQVQQRCARVLEVVCLGEIPSEAHELEWLKLVGPSQWRTRPCTNLPPAATLEDVAYVIFTSGSTGKPKGIVVEHRAAANLIDWVNTTFSVGPTDRLLFVASMCFDLSVYDLFGVLGAGGSLQLADEATIRDPQALLQLLLTEPITFWDSAPAALQQLTDGFPSSGTRGTEHLRLVFNSGDWIPLWLPPAVRRSFPQARFIALGGATEATVWSNWHEVQQVPPHWVSIPYGKPIRNARYYVLDKHLQPCPIGVAGSLYIGGACLARGYTDALQTAERFIVSPLPEEPGRLYHTGDLARYWPDGTLQFLGRVDLQVKIRGYRIELEEIEAVLRRHSGVHDAVVLVREDTPGDPRLVAYVIGEDLDLSAVRAQAMNLLPQYMRPATYVVLSAWPVSANGKLDRKALPAPPEEARTGVGYEAPLPGLETQLATLWAEVLKLPQVGRRDHFFELGGHSLLAVALIARLRKEFDIEAPLKELFSHPILSEFAQVTRGAQAATLPPITAAAREVEIPLSWVQQRLWFLSQMEGVSEAYHISMAVRLSGALDNSALQRAVDRIVHRHEALRTTFEHVEGRCTQRIAASTTGCAVKEYDLRGSHASAAALEAIKVEETGRAFDLARGPLLRVALIRIRDDERVLLLTMHHIVSDEWSMGVLLRELSVLYAAYSRGEDDPLPPLAIQYADFALWQRRWDNDDSRARHSAYWRETLEGAPTLLALPTDHPRPERQDYRGAVVPIEIDAPLVKRLRVLARHHGVTLYMTVLAAWSVVLVRLSGQDDIVVGTPLANRDRTELEPLIGFFVNTLALRLRAAGTTRITHLLEHVKQRFLEAQQHRSLPFEAVVELVRPPRSMAHTPIFQVMLSWQNVGSAQLELQGLQMRPESSGYGNAKFDLMLSLGESGERLSGGLEYATSLFERDTIERHAGYLRRVLQAMAADDQQAIARIALLDEPERQLQLLEWNRVETQFHHGRCIHQAFEEWAARQPEAIALVYEDQVLGYGELNARANRLAHYLHRIGVGPDVRVAVCIQRGFDMVIALLAILKAGGAYVPLDPDYPPQRLIYMLTDSQPAVMLTDANVAASLRAQLLCSAAPRLLNLTEDAALWAQEPGHNLDPASLGLTSRHLAYVIYTSGSTGQPKGVMVEHANVVRLFLATQRHFQFGQHDVWTLFHSYAFDFAVWEMWGALTHGGRLVVVPLPVARSPSEFYELLHRHAVTVLNQTPSSFQQLALAQASTAQAHALRLVIFGGESLKPATLRPWFADTRNAATQLVNMYGITETTVHVTYRALQATDALIAGSPIGRALADLQIYILDEHLELVPLGAVGELYIAGAGVTRGYLNRQELTAQRFIADPFSEQVDARLYKSGDLGRYLRDGSIEFIGRNDAQVKIRGHRIELGEIESRLLAHPDVREAVVLAGARSVNDVQLTAYIVGNSSPCSLDIAALRSHLSAQLPDYMIPAAYVALEALPLTKHGKLDRQALPEPDRAAHVARAYEAPAGRTELKLAAIWQNALGLERVGRHDNFFELGGHSLLAVTVIEQMRGAGMHTDVRMVFAAPTLSALASAVDAHTLGPRPVEVPPNRIASSCATITPELLPLVQLTQAEIDDIAAATPGGATNIQDIYPLAPAQSGILFHHLMVRKGDPYLVSTLHGFRDRGRLNRYVQALQAVVDRHDILRTAVRWERLSEPVQVVWRHAPLAIEEMQFDAFADVAEQLSRHCDSRQYRLDVREAPLLRLFVAEDQPNRRWLLLTLTHHLACDHTTLEAVEREIHSHLAGRWEELPPPVSFRSFVAHARLGVSREEHEAFFRQMLADVDEPTMPFGLPSAQVDGWAVREHRQAVDQELSLRLRARARMLGVSAASLFHLAWALVLARASGRDDVVFGTVLFGRMQGIAGADRVLGMFINTLPVRIRIDARPVLDCVQETHRLLTSLLYHEHAPLALAQRCSQVMAPQALFTALFNYRHSAIEAAAAQAEPPNTASAWEGIEFLKAQEHSSYLLNLDVDDLGQDFQLNVQVHSSVDPQYVGTLMSEALESLAGALEHSPTASARSLDVLPAVERKRLLADCNRTQAPYPQECCIHQLFEAQVALRPDAPALIEEGRTLTFAQLNAEANRLAHYLRELGVAPESRVALCVEHSAEMVVAVLAVLKAGGAYVPMDPAYPSARLAFMLGNSRPAALLLHAPQAKDSLTELRVAAQACGVRDILDMSADAHRWTVHPDANLPAHEVGVAATHLAYVIYTSGSTGQPKGVMVEHRQVCAQVSALSALAHLGATDRVLQFASLAFDVAVEEIFCAITNGAALALRTPAWLTGASEFWAQCARQQVSVLDLPMMFWEQLALDGHAVIPECVRLILTGGEAAHAEPMAAWFARSGHRPRLFNAYGPTETTVNATVHEVTTGADWRLIGRPLANVCTYVLDAHGRPTPVAVAGELYIGGAGVSRGYWGNPELTAERFLPDPFVQAPQARMYRTGDVCRRLADGLIEFAGRNDHQVKIRGFRIELGEIEACLRNHPGVQDAVVVVREDLAARGKQLVAYLTSPDGAEVSTDQLRTYLHGLLPEYMVPAAHVLLPSLPVTSSGKIDRQALPSPQACAYAHASFEAPRGDVEVRMAKLWAGLLEVDRVGRHDNFFELGGHSLLAITLIEQMRREGLNTDVRALFSTPTVAALAATTRKIGLLRL